MPVVAALEEDVPLIQAEQTVQPAATVVGEEQIAPLQTPEAPTEPIVSAKPVVQPAVAFDEPSEPPLVLPPLLINRVVAGLTGQSSYEYIELYNPNPHDVVLDSWRVMALRKDGDTKQEILLHGTVKANSYVLIAGTDSALDDFGPDERLLEPNTIVLTGGIIRLIDTANTTIEQLHWGDTLIPSLALATGSALERNYIDGVPSLTGDNQKDFTSNVVTNPPRAGGYIPYAAPINHCSGVMISEVAANMADDKQFVELYNTLSSPVTLDQCLLQTNRSTTKSFALTGTIGAGEYLAPLIASTGLTLTKTTAGTVYLLSSDGKEETDSRSYDSLTADTSWSWFGGSDWRQTFSPSPRGANVWQEFLPCEAGYERGADTGYCRKMAATEAETDCGTGKYRSPETNRCRNVEIASDLASCRAEQYRSSDTNRCRNLESPSTLAACKAGQYRNPETNRCRSTATLASALTPCKENQERNPATNRCRNVTKTIPTSAFAAEPVQDDARTFAGWWALAGVSTLAFGYAGWEWRREVFGGLQKLGSFFAFRK